MLIDDIVTFFLAYLLGSIPFGLIVTRLAGKGDIRKIGSGNIGATNVLRTGSKGLAALTLLLDAGKGFLAVYLANIFVHAPVGVDPDPMAHDRALFCAGLGVLIGHIFPIWLKFKGGKGVATALGVFLGLSWQIGLVGCLTWLLTALLFRFSSLAAIISMVCAALVAFLASKFDWFGMTIYNVFPELAVLVTSPKVIAIIAIALIVILRHHANIRRLLNGTEPKIGKTNAAA